MRPTEPSAHARYRRILRSRLQGALPLRMPSLLSLLRARLLLLIPRRTRRPSSPPALPLFSSRLGTFTNSSAEGIRVRAAALPVRCRDPALTHHLPYYSSGRVQTLIWTTIEQWRKFDREYPLIPMLPHHVPEVTCWSAIPRILARQGP